MNQASPVVTCWARPGQSCKEPNLQTSLNYWPFRLALHATQMGKGWLAGLQFLAGLHTGASDRIHAQPPGNKAHLSHLEFPEMRMED